MKTFLARTAGALALLVATGGLAHASVVATQTNYFTMNGGCSDAANCGSVTVDQLSDGQLYFQVQLATGISFNLNDNGQHPSFAFSLEGAGVSDWTISGLPTGSPNYWQAEAASFPADYTAPPFTGGASGDFNTAIAYVGKAQGVKQGATPDSLSFYVTDGAGGPALTLADLEPGGGLGGLPTYFSADIYNAGAGFTGNVGAAPEPATWALMLLGIGGVGGALRLARRKAAVAAAA